jgi:putative salt-induced outer membrane protein YdiY
LSLQTGFELKRKTESKTLAIDVDYRHSSSRNVTIQENGRLNIDYDRLIGSAWSGFGKFGLEWDRFKAFDLRLNFNGGIGHHLIRRKDASLVSRFGAGRSRETGAPVDAWINEAIFGIDAERQLTSRQKLKARVDFFPSLETSSNYRLVGDVAWEMLLDGSDNLSLKLAATDRYDSTPQGAEPNDIYFSVLLLRKF